MVAELESEAHGDVVPQAAEVRAAGDVHAQLAQAQAALAKKDAALAKKDAEIAALHALLPSDAQALHASLEQNRRTSLLLGKKA